MVKFHKAATSHISSWRINSKYDTELSDMANISRQITLKLLGITKLQIYTECPGETTEKTMDIFRSP